MTATALLTALLSISYAQAQENAPAEASEEEAVATMVNAEGQETGTATFRTTPSGIIHIMLEMTEVPPGPHGLHIHETGTCDAEGGFESAGGHYAGDAEHGVNVEGGPHPGDLPNVHVGQDGVLRAEFFTDRVSLSADGENPLRDDDGSALVLHAAADDYSSQPSGESGDRIACGVIE